MSLLMELCNTMRELVLCLRSGECLAFGAKIYVCVYIRAKKIKVSLWPQVLCSLLGRVNHVIM